MNTTTHRVAELTVQLYRRDGCEAHDGPYYYITITSVQEERLPFTNVLPDEHTFFFSSDFQPHGEMFTSYDYDENSEPCPRVSTLTKVASLHIGGSPDTR